MKRHRSTRQDANQRELVEYARYLGMSVHVTSALGGEVLDLLVGYAGLDVQVEVKDPDGTARQQRLTAGEAVTFAAWAGAKPRLWMTPDDVDETRRQLMGAAMRLKS